MDKETARSKIERQLDELKLLSSSNTSSVEFQKWYRRTEIAIERVFDEDRDKNKRHLNDFSGVRWVPKPKSYNILDPEPAYAEAYERGFQIAQSVLESMVWEIDEHWNDPKQELSDDARTIVEVLCSRFHTIAQQLQYRYENRPTIKVEDEHDVKDLLHALLRIRFDDIQKEEWTPSIAGNSARVDFLLKLEEIVVEVKKTRSDFGSKQVVDELKFDIERYKAHPDCQCLICFIYDPEGRIGDPRSIRSDLAGMHDELDVQVIIAP